MLFYDAKWLLQLLQLLRGFFILLTKSILEKEKRLKFYADVIFCLFISIILLSSSLFLLSYFNKNVKETKYFEKNSCGFCCLWSFVSCWFYSNIEVFLTQSVHCFLDNGSENGVITSNCWGFLNTGKKLVFYLIVVKGYF